MWSKVYWVDAAERTIRSFAQSLLATIGLNQTPIFDLDWLWILGVSLTYALTALLSYVIVPPSATPFGNVGVPGADEEPATDATPEEGAEAMSRKTSLHWDRLKEEGE